ncbi:MAG TPA: nucleotide exchange factor GrpE [Candidatus Xenobia bacterium]|nr:nucleotide exchange factor GrpE [Candidatus Xenobia bacterium]
MNDETKPEVPAPETRAEVAAEEAGVDYEVRKLQAQIDSLNERLKKLEEEKQAVFAQLVRRQADHENFRKRAEKEKQAFRQKAEIELLAKLLPVVDGFERALASATNNTDDYRKGIELIYKQLTDILARAGLERIETFGQAFDPLVHHAIERVETTDYPDHQVLGELQAGYRFKNELVRPALVRVAVHPAGNAKPAEESKSEPVT